MGEFDIHTLQHQPEGQQFDRKSFRIDAKSLAVILVAFANADGGDVVIGIEDDGRITGINGNDDHLNELLRAPFDFCVPSVNVEVHFIDCTDANGTPNRVLVMHVEPSMQVHANQADDAFYRVGDKSKKLNFEMRMQLFYAKGGRYYEDEPVYGATMDDLDLDYVKEFCDKIGYAKDAETYLRTNKGYVTTANGADKVSGAAILLFGKDPQKFFQRARIRIVRYDGDEERFGREMNVVKDVSFEGRIVEMTQKAIDFVDTQIKEYSFLGEDARFVTIPQYPPFCWTELIVNAVAHRDYSILGTDIIVKIFDHHYVVESPGILPGMVRIDNIRQMHFSRNPKIVQFMQQYKLVKEFGEGVDRMFREMAEAGNPAPEYKQIDFMLKVKLTSAMREEKDTAKKSNMKSNMILEKSSVKNEHLIIETIKANPSAPIPIFQKITGLSRSGIWKILNRLRENEVVRRIGSDRDGYWEIVEKSEMEGALKSKKKNKNGIANDTVNSTENGTENALENDTVNDRMDNEKKLLFAIIEHPNYTYEQYAELIHISRRTIARMLKNLHENGIIRRVGPDKGGHWEVIGNE
ncbi:MAG: putative DNA binding domain-containing protein [Bacteroidales bacterium]|nr:putative DNA binding domain-containing protein [Bacteroidales bacterium]